MGEGEESSGRARACGAPGSDAGGPLPRARLERLGHGRLLQVALGLDVSCPDAHVAGALDELEHVEVLGGEALELGGLLLAELLVHERARCGLYIFYTQPKRRQAEMRGKTWAGEIRSFPWAKTEAPLRAGAAARKRLVKEKRSGGRRPPAPESSCGDGQPPRQRGCREGNERTRYICSLRLSSSELIAAARSATGVPSMARPRAACKAHVAGRPRGDERRLGCRRT